MTAPWQILVGDARARLHDLGDEHFQCVVTSPPYWGLRDYGVEGQIGLEDTPEEFIDRLIDVFAEVVRVMRPDGTLWINMGDSYSSDGGTPTQGKTGVMRGRAASESRESAGRRALCGRKPKDLVGQPWMLAFALRDRLGLYLRAEVIWHKRSVMPESTKDRPTRAHEQLFLLSKSERYYYDAFAVREVGASPAGTRAAKGSAKRRAGRGVNARPPEYAVYSGMRNRRSVWTLGPEPSSTPHFATFPTKLVEPCILAGTSERGACAGCGAPWQRVLSKATGGAIGASWLPHDAQGDAERGNFKTTSSEGYTPGKTIGWRASCSCEGAAVIPCAVLDPFAGTATTGVVALRHGRAFAGIELNPTYAELARARLVATAAEVAAPLFDRAGRLASSPALLPAQARSLARELELEFGAAGPATAPAEASS